MKTKKVSDIMTRVVVSITPEMQLTDAIKVMLKTLGQVLGK